MKKYYVMFAMACIVLANCKEKENKEEALASEDISMENMKEMDENDWIVLFDGTSFDGWKGYMKDGMAANWKIEDGAMVFYPPDESTERGELQHYFRTRVHQLCAFPGMESL